MNKERQSFGTKAVEFSRKVDKGVMLVGGILLFTPFALGGAGLIIGGGTSLAAKELIHERENKT